MSRSATTFGNYTTTPSLTAADMMAAMRKAKAVMDEVRGDLEWHKPNTMLGIRVMELPDMVVTTIRKRPCTNRRQLWRKWHATKIIRTPNMNCYLVAGETLVGHPAAIARMTAGIERRAFRMTIGPED